MPKSAVEKVLGHLGGPVGDKFQRVLAGGGLHGVIHMWSMRNAAEVPCMPPLSIPVTAWSSLHVSLNLLAFQSSFLVLNMDCYYERK